MGTSYLGGLAIYTFRIPERFFPGKFDIIVLILTIIGIITQYMACVCILRSVVLIFWST